MITGGKYASAYFADSSSITFKFNDVNSTATAVLNTAYLMQLVRSTVTIKNNIFMSSWTVSASSASLYADQTSGFASDYNNWFSSHSAAGAVLLWTNAAGVRKAYNFPWGLGKDANSLNPPANPYWFNPSAGIEDFHPMSTAGRYNPVTGNFENDGTHSKTIDAADNLEPVSLETVPHGGRANQGSYGQTAEASRSGASLADSCGITKNVKKSDAFGIAFSSITGAIADLPSTLGTDACVIVRDTWTYSEQVTVRNFALTYSTNTLKIFADPSFVSSAPAVNPPTASTAAFQIANASVTIQNITIITTNTVQYGIWASSPNVTISSVNIDAGGNPDILLWTAGIAITSNSFVSYSSITVQNANGLWITGDQSNVSYSTAANNASGSSRVTLHLNGVSSNTITQSYFSNLGGVSVRLNANADYNTISQSTITSTSSV